MVAGAKVQSYPRLWQSGPLTGEMHFQGLNSARARIGKAILFWPPEPVRFDPNPVEGLTLSYEHGRLRLKLRVTGPVLDDIMVFGQAPCSAGRKKWRHGAYLGLLPTPAGGEIDITELYVSRYGELEPGQRVFIRTRQQQNGWEARDKDLSALIPIAPSSSAAKPTSEECSAPDELRRIRTPSRWRFCVTNPLIPRRCAMHKGVAVDPVRSLSRLTLGRRHQRYGCATAIVSRRQPAQGRWSAHRRELWHGT
jgi:hypothetical protein